MTLQSCILIKPAIHLVITALLGLSFVRAGAPAPPLEFYLMRAETVFIGRITSKDKKEISFEVVEMLRGRGDEKKIDLRPYAIDPESITTNETPTAWLVVSQGDDRFGPPRQVMSLGTQLDGQCCYRGWIAFPIVEESGSRYVGRAHTNAIENTDERPARVTLEMARVLVQEFLYRSDVNSDGFIRVRGLILGEQGEIIEGATVALEANGIKYVQRRSNVDGLYSLEANAATKKSTVWLMVKKEGYKLYRKGLVTNSAYDQKVVLEKVP